MNFKRYNQSLVQECYSDGTLCYSCGELNEGLVFKTSRLLKQPNGKPYLCSKCKEVLADEIKSISGKKFQDTGYTVDISRDNVTFKSALEQGFIFIDEKEDELYV